MSARLSVSLALLASLGLPVEATARQAGEATRMVDVDGQPTHVLTLGLEQRAEGDPVIVLQAGGGISIPGWFDWPNRVAELAPVIAYERIGTGRTPYNGSELSIERVNGHLHRLLDVLDVPPPYVLVGHSWGGPLNLFYAAAHPDDVVGLVYLDPTDARLTRLEYMAANSEEQLAERWAEFEAEPIEDPGAAAQDRYVNDFMKTPLEERGVPADPLVPTAVVLGNWLPQFGNAGDSFTDEAIEHMYALQVERFSESIGTRRNGAVFMSGDAGHNVAQDDPELALHAVRHVLARIAPPVDRALLESYVGEYELNATVRITIALDEYGLTTEITGQGRAPLTALSDTRFRVHNGVVTHEFVREGDRVTSLVVSQNGEYVLRRVRE